MMNTKSPVPCDNRRNGHGGHLDSYVCLITLVRFTSSRSIHTNGNASWHETRSTRYFACFCQGAAVQRRHWTVCHNARSRTSLCRLSNRWHYVTELGSIVAQRVIGKKLLKVQIPKPYWQQGFFDHLLRNGDSYSRKWEYGA